ncbi:MAG: ABC transporter ATP-binding protein [Desulfobacterales bacterium]|nr:ABC transporter ATP-binding protein [Desulfobacterales bacterium]
MLSIKNLVVHYGGVQALKGISLEVKEGSITSLIGANGAGKSTTLRAVSGLIPSTSGEIRFEGKRIDGLDTERIVELGIVHVPEGKRLFLEMSIQDNLLSGAYLSKNKDRQAKDLERIYGYFPVLKDARYRPASKLSGGEQQMVAICRGLMANPKLLLLDEPSLGLSPLLTNEVGAIIKRIADEGVSILLIEQNASLALSLSSNNYVMETGTIAVEGKSSELQNNDHVKAAYLGIVPGEEITKKVPAIPSKDKIVETKRQEWQEQKTVVSGNEVYEENRPPHVSQTRWDTEQEQPQKIFSSQNSVRWPVSSGSVNQWGLDQALPKKQGNVRNTGLKEQGAAYRWTPPGSLSFEKKYEARWRDEKSAQPRVIKKSYVPSTRGSN